MCASEDLGSAYTDSRTPRQRAPYSSTYTTRQDGTMGMVAVGAGTISW